MADHNMGLQEGVQLRTRIQEVLQEGADPELKQRVNPRPLQDFVQELPLLIEGVSAMYEAGVFGEQEARKDQHWLELGEVLLEGSGQIRTTTGKGYAFFFLPVALLFLFTVLGVFWAGFGGLSWGGYMFGVAGLTAVLLWGWKQGREKGHQPWRLGDMSELRLTSMLLDKAEKGLEQMNVLERRASHTQGLDPRRREAVLTCLKWWAQDSQEQDWQQARLTEHPDPDQQKTESSRAREHG